MEALPDARPQAANAMIAERLKRGRIPANQLPDDATCFLRAAPERPNMTACFPGLPVSGVVITKNEGDRIERCVRSMAGLCQEVIVLDSGSTDDTVARAQAAGATVAHQDWLGFSGQKNAVLERASQPWILLLDADEWLGDGTDRRIRKLFASGRVENADIWRLFRRTHFLGKPLNFGGWGSEAKARLFRRELRYRSAHVHEKLEMRGQRKGYLLARIEHDTARSEAEYRTKLGRYAALFAVQNHAKGITAHRYSPVMHAAFYLLKNYLLRGGFLDGPMGLRYHRCHAHYTRDKWARLRQLNENPGQSRLS